MKYLYLLEDGEVTQKEHASDDQIAKDDDGVEPEVDVSYSISKWVPV